MKRIQHNPKLDKITYQEIYNENHDPDNIEKESKEFTLKNNIEYIKKKYG